MSQTNVVHTDSIEQDEIDREKKQKKQKSRRPASMIKHTHSSGADLMLMIVVQIPPSDNRD